MWVLILVKLLTPPVWQIPIVDRDWLISFVRPVKSVVIAKTEVVEPTAQVTNSTLSLVADNTRPAPKPRPRTLAERDQRMATKSVSPMTATVRWMRGQSARQLLFDVLLIVWAVGALIWFSVQGFRCVRFRLSLANGCAAPPELQQFSNELAGRLGLKRSPTVWLMPGVMSPMLWGTGQSSLLIFPEQLLDRLDPDATGTLLTHELAHYRRRDHWVRIVALAATGFFWWHPVIWWARREIEAVEEECCDALVVKASTAPPKRYAEAILETVDFLAEFRLKMPPLATGLGQVPFLRQRLTWIMRGPRRQDLGYCGRVLCLLVLCTVPWQPTWVSARTSAPVVVPQVPFVPIQHEESPASPLTIIESGELADASQPQIVVPMDETPVVPSRWSGYEVRSHSTDGRFVVMGNKSSHSLLDLESGKDFDLTDYVIRAMAFSPSSNQFVTIGSDGMLRLWNGATCEVRQAWQIPGGPAKSVDISSDGCWIVTGGRDGVIRVWSFGSPLPVRELPRESAPVNCVRFSSNDELLAAATGDWMSPQSGRIALFNVGSWAERISMNWNSPAAVVAFRADGDSLTSGDWQGRIARWSLATGELLGLTEGHKDLVAVAEFSPNGSSLHEIHVPDLVTDSTWEESDSRDEFRWFFNRWPMKSQGTNAVPRSNGQMIR